MQNRPHEFMSHRNKKQTMIDLGIRKIHRHTDPIHGSIRKYTDPLRKSTCSKLKFLLFCSLC